MGRPKKIKETKKEIDIDLEIDKALAEESLKEETPRITPFVLDLGREDLNRLVAKINEIIELIK